MRMLTPIGYPSVPSSAELSQWSVLEVEDDDGTLARLLTGLLNGSETRVRLTSQIEQLEGGRALTRSGSVYTLVGPPASEEQVAAQASRRSVLLAGRQARDVTQEYVTRIERGG